MGKRETDKLRRRLWLAVIAGLAGCMGDAPVTGEAPQEVAAPDVPRVETEPPGGQENPRKMDVGGLSRVVDTALADAIADAERARIEAAKPTVDAAVVCEVAMDKAAAFNGREPKSTDRLGCPQRASQPGGGSKYSGMRLSTGPTQTLRDGNDHDNCCYKKLRRPVRGRPYRVEGTRRLPDIGVGPRHPQCTDDGVDARLTRAAAAGWLRDAREELASVPAFERAALELEMAGAPPSLVEGCLVAAQQERRHTALCLTIAERLAGRDLRLGPPPEVRVRQTTLLQLLLNTFEEGCVGETIAAVVATRSARGADPDVAAALHEIAADETDHAALAWRTLGWGMTRLTATERAEFFGRAQAGLRGPGSGRRGSDVLKRHGRLSAECQTQIAHDVCLEVVAPLLQQFELSLPVESSRDPLAAAVGPATPPARTARTAVL